MGASSNYKLNEKKNDNSLELEFSKKMPGGTIEELLDDINKNDSLSEKRNNLINYLNKTIEKVKEKEGFNDAKVINCSYKEESIKNMNSEEKHYYVYFTIPFKQDVYDVSYDFHNNRFLMEPNTIIKASDLA